MSVITGPIVATNYCSFVPDAPFGFDFSGACAQHDLNYSTLSTVTRLQADLIFRDSMHSICTTNYGGDWLCHLMADSYFVGVRLLGAPYYEGPGGI